MNIRALLGLVGLMLIISCTPSFYMPNLQNIPAIDKKGQVSINVATSSFRSFELQGAYGFTNSLAAQLNVIKISSRPNAVAGGSAFFIEAGPGYFYNITSFMLADIYPVIGWGNFENHYTGMDPDLHGNISANVFRYGIQPSFTFHWKFAAFSFSYRIVNVDYSNIKGNLIHKPYDEEIDQVKFLREHSSSFRLEPAITFKFGNEFTKFLFQGQFSEISPHIEFPSCPDVWSIGFQFNFNAIKLKEDETPETKF